MKKSKLLAVFLMIMLLTSGCVTLRKDTTTYVPLYAAGKSWSGSRGTKNGDYEWASKSPTLQEASLRWEEYLEKHYSKKDAFEDGQDLNRSNTAKYELMRIYYMLGRQTDADRILRQFDPLDLL